MSEYPKAPASGLPIQSVALGVVGSICAAFALFSILFFFLGVIVGDLFPQHYGAFYRTFNPHLPKITLLGRVLGVVSVVILCIGYLIHRRCLFQSWAWRFALVFTVATIAAYGFLFLIALILPHP